MTENPRCPKCGTPLPADAGAAGCPRCLLAAGLGSGEAPSQSPPSAPSPEEMGKHFPLFEILELLGQGGMGIVYKAKQRSLDRLVALKVMPPDAARDAGFADRFSREARTLARLQHPNIVGVHDFGVSDGLYYLSMEYVDGANLREAIRAGKLSAREALAIVPQICDALQYAHDQGVVHRDIKPENILLDRAGRVRIADFGLAKIVQRTPLEMTLTRQGQVMGTLHYMAPEQYRTPDSVDHRADIYSLGVVFYEMLTGELPLGSFPPPSDKAGVDARLDGVVLRALERERDRRWQHASDLKTQVSAISGAGGPAPSPVPAAASASAPAGPTTPAAAAAAFVPADPPTHRLALAGGLTIPGSLALGLVVYLLVLLFTWGSTGAAASAATWIMALALVTGFVLSIVAWIQVHQSRGRLGGKAWAVVGTLVTPFFICCGMPFITHKLPGDFGVASGPNGERVHLPWLSVEEGPGGTRVKMPGLTVEDGPEGSRVKMPGIDIHEAREGAAEVKVVGSVAGMKKVEKDLLVAGQEALWIQSTMQAVQEGNPDAKALRLSPAEQAKYGSMSSWERKQAGLYYRLGILFLDAEAEFGRKADKLRLAWIAVGEGGDRARVVRTDGAVTISYPVVREGRRWYPALGPVEKADRGLEDSDRCGWLTVVQGEGMDPAARVTGGPASTTETFRAEAADGLGKSWKPFESYIRKFLDLREGDALPELRLYAARLDDGGTSGRFVLTDGKEITVAAPFRFESEGARKTWLVDTDGIELRRTPARPDDRYGRLSK
jgi:serine/threonine protein kinase